MSYIKILLSIIVLSMFTILSNAQEINTNQNKEVNSLFETTHPLGFYIGIQHISYKEKGDAGPFNHSLNSIWAPNFGIKYNLLERNKFLLNAGLGASLIKNSTFHYSYTGDLDVYNITSSENTMLSIFFNLTGEYIFYSKGDTSFSIHLGYELLNAGFGNYPGFIKEDPYSTGTVHMYALGNTKKLTHGINLGIGAYQKLGKRLMKFELNYHIHTSTIIPNRLIAKDFPNHPDVDHSVNWNGNHLSAKATFYPFKRSKK